MSLRAYLGPFGCYFPNSSQNYRVTDLVETLLNTGSSSPFWYEKYLDQDDPGVIRWVLVCGHRAGDLALGTSESGPVQALLWLQGGLSELRGEGSSMWPHPAEGPWEVAWVVGREDSRSKPTLFSRPLLAGGAGLVVGGLDPMEQDQEP